MSTLPNWRAPDPVAVPEPLAAAVGSPVLAELLYRRGFTTAQAMTDFLADETDVDAPDLPDLEAGVTLLARSVHAGARICVYGDYDTDGVTATALLVGVLRTLGAGVTYYIPNRFRDGYGMNVRAVEALAAEGTAVILTCDCGIKSVVEVATARRLGVQVVVTDHHELGPELPNAEAVINPKRLPDGHPCRMLPGVGVAYLVGRRLLAALGHDPDEADAYLDLVAVGIIADVVPLGGANRVLARRGLGRLTDGPRLGLTALLAVAGLGPDLLTEEDVAFQVVPRLNSAGRLADAALAVGLLLSTDPAEARDLAQRLDELNQERKHLTAELMAAATVESGAPAIILYRPEWHEGVLGIAAGRLAEQHGLPTLLLTRKHDGALLAGSARAPAGFALHEALQACAEHLTRFGGHAAAAGFALLEERLPAFRAAFLEEARRRSTVGAARPERQADLTLPLSAVGLGLYDDLRRAAPFGEAHPEPVLFAPGVHLLSARPIGPGQKHLRLVLRDGEQSLTGIWWGQGGTAPGLPWPTGPANGTATATPAARLGGAPPIPTRPTPGVVDLFYRLNRHRWQGEVGLQVIVEALGPGAEARPLPAEASAARAAVPPRPRLVDRRGQDPTAEFPTALRFAEADQAALPGTVDRYGLRGASDLVLLSPPPSPRLLDEILAVTGATSLVLAWSSTPLAGEERFLPVFLSHLARDLDRSPYVSVALLAIKTGELESVIHAAIDALGESRLLAIEERDGDRLRLRRRPDGRGVRESSALEYMRRLLAESRAFRRFLRTAPVPAIERVIAQKEPGS